jgi:hypothetical protein
MEFPQYINHSKHERTAEENSEVQLTNSTRKLNTLEDRLKFLNEKTTTSCDEFWFV